MESNVWERYLLLWEAAGGVDGYPRPPIHTPPPTPNRPPLTPRPVPPPPPPPPKR
jgi:hypothetical protein